MTSVTNTDPIIWKEFSKGQQRFWIQNVEDEHFDAIVHAMMYSFFKDEPFGMFGKLLEDFNFIQSLKVEYSDIIQKKHSLVCLTKVDGKPTIVGFHILEIAVDGEKSERYRFTDEIVNYLLSCRNICTELGVKKYVMDRGLFVFPEFRGNGISCQLLQCWSLVCESLGLKLGLGAFTSKYSQAAAERAGLLQFYSTPYVEIRKINPELVPLGIEQHTTNLMLFYICP